MQLTFNFSQICFRQAKSLREFAGSIRAAMASSNSAIVQASINALRAMYRSTKNAPD